MSQEKDEVLSCGEDEEIGSEDHEKEVSDSEVFSCKYCVFQTYDIDELDEHIINHEEALIEDDHEKEADKSRTDGDDISVSSKYTVFASKNSDGDFDTEPPKRVKQLVPAFYEEFKNKTDKRVFVCPYCGYQTMKKLDINKHLKVHREPVEVPVYACAECPYTTRRKCDMPKHLLTHCKDGSVPMYKCQHCPYATKRKGDLPKHMLCHKKPDLDAIFRCPQCTYFTKRRGDLKKHFLSHESDFGGVRELFNCTECGYTSKRLNDLHKHVVLHCDKAVKGILKCTKCEYASNVSTHFAKHVLSNCRFGDMGVAIFPKDSETMQDFIVLEEDELHLYQLEKESFTSVEVLENDEQVIKNRKRKRPKEKSFMGSEHSHVDNYYVADEESLEESVLKEVHDRRKQDKVLVLAGYEDGEKTDCQEI